MMNENNNVFTLEDEPLATVVQNMRKGSKWLSAFLENYRPPLDGERYLTDREVAEGYPELAGNPAAAEDAAPIKMYDCLDV